MKKQIGDSVVRDGRRYYWFPHQKFSGFYNGLYVTHPPDKHDKWRDCQDQIKKQGKYGSRQASTNN